MGSPNLPVVVQSNCIIGSGCALKEIGQAKVQTLLILLPARFHDADMGDEIPGQIEAGQVDTPMVALQGVENPVGQPLGGLPLCIAREHAVDIRVVQRPEPAADIHGKLGSTGNDQDARLLSQVAFCLENLQTAYQAAGNIHLLIFISSDGPHHRQGLLLSAEMPTIDGN